MSVCTRPELNIGPGGKNEYETQLPQGDLSGAGSVRLRTTTANSSTHRLRVRLLYERLDVFIDGTHLLTLPHGDQTRHGSAIGTSASETSLPSSVELDQLEGRKLSHL
jgi:hypothetical protein